MNIVGLFVYFYTRKAHYTGALILMGDLQLCKKSCRNRAWLEVNRCVFVAGKRQNWLSISVHNSYSGGDISFTSRAYAVGDVSCEYKIGSVNTIISAYLKI